MSVTVGSTVRLIRFTKISSDLMHTYVGHTGTVKRVKDRLGQRVFEVAFRRPGDSESQTFHVYPEEVEVVDAPQG